MFPSSSDNFLVHDPVSILYRYIYSLATLSASPIPGNDRKRKGDCRPPPPFFSVNESSQFFSISASAMRDEVRSIRLFFKRVLRRESALEMDGWKARIAPTASTVRRVFVKVRVLLSERKPSTLQWTVPKEYWHMPGLGGVMMDGGIEWAAPVKRSIWRFCWARILIMCTWWIRHNS